MNRRAFLVSLPFLYAGRLFAAPSAPARFLLVFLRGGYDAANVLVPVNVVFQSGHSQWAAQVFGEVASPQYPGLYQIAFQFPPDMNGGPTVDLLLGAGQDFQTFHVAFTQ